MQPCCMYDVTELDSVYWNVHSIIFCDISCNLLHASVAVFDFHATCCTKTQHISCCMQQSCIIYIGLYAYIYKLSHHTPHIFAHDIMRPGSIFCPSPDYTPMGVYFGLVHFIPGGIICPRTE